MIALGLPDLVGGMAAFDAGMLDLTCGLMTVAAELVTAEHQGVDLADAVLDPVRFPHTAQMHGVISDTLDANVPAELEGWAWKVARAGPPPDASEIGRAIAALAVAAANPFHRALGHFALFEILCVQHRLNLRRGRIRLETLDGRRTDVEVLACQEVEAACCLASSGPDLLSVDDPLTLIEKLALAAFARHVDVLRDELTTVSKDVHEQLKRRERILEAAERADAADAILILNETAEEFGEERLSAEQLRRLHPLLWDSEDALYKRVERLPKNVNRCGARKGRSFGDLMVAIMKEIDP